MTTFDHGLIAGYEWHTHYYNDQPVHTHAHPSAGAGSHNHGDCFLVLEGDAISRLFVGAVDGPRLAGEIVPMEVMLGVLAEPPSEAELASARTRLGEMLSRLSVVAASPCSCHCHTFGGSHVVACC